MTTRLFHCDDSAAMRLLVREQFAADHRVEIVGGADDPASAVRGAAESQPDVVLLDLLDRRTRSAGRSCAGRARREVVVLSGHPPETASTAAAGRTATSRRTRRSPSSARRCCASPAGSRSGDGRTRPRRATAPSATSRATPEPAGGAGARARRARRASSSRSTRHAPALGPAPRARRRARVVGGAQRAARGRRRTTAWRCAPRTTRSSTSSFHGEIPKGDYGAGTMTIWDQRHLRAAQVGARARSRSSCTASASTARYALFPIGKADDPRTG